MKPQPTISISRKLDYYYESRPGTIKRWKVDNIIFNKEEDAIALAKYTGQRVYRVWIKAE